MSRVGERLKKARTDAGLSVKQTARKLGVAESFVNDVELGRKVVSEDLLKRFSKVFGEDVSQIGLGSLEESVLFEEATKTKNVIKETAYVPPKEPVNELWNQAFGDKLKNVPLYDVNLKKSMGYRTYAVENKRIEGQPMDKVLAVMVQEDSLKGYRIEKGDLLLCVEAREIQGSAILVVEYKGKRALRHVTNKNNGQVELATWKQEKQVETLPLKEVKALARVFKVEFNL